MSYEIVKTCRVILKTRGFYTEYVSRVNKCSYRLTNKETILTEKATRKGGRVTRLVSTSPSGELRTIRTFEFSE